MKDNDGLCTVAKTSVPIDSGWQFRLCPRKRSTSGQSDAVSAVEALAHGQWLPAAVPGNVHLDLLSNQLIPDPFFRDNEAGLQWIHEEDWEYRTTLMVDGETLKRECIELVFEGLDAAAIVSLNDTPVLRAKNMFRLWRVDAKAHLHQGANLLSVVFPSPIRAALEAQQAVRVATPTVAQAKTYIRKAAYEYGWDWGPTLVTSGIWRPVRLESWSLLRISDLHVRQRDVSHAAANLTVEVDLLATVATVAKVKVCCTHPQGSHTVDTRRVALHPGLNHVVLPFNLEQPQRWYPAGYGEQPLYTFTAIVTAASTRDEARVETGLRSVELRRELDEWGRSFEFVINGIPVYAKGANVIPLDSFPSRVTPEEYRHILQSAVDANMNMIRVWGGGYYEADLFYSICDELGLMVWQDFMFGNEWQPGDYEWKQNVAQEAEDQVRRLRNHPSIVLWCGNNETEGALNWDQTPVEANWNQNKAPESTRFQMWQDYLTTFSGILPRTVARLVPEVPYWPSSPSADYEPLTETFQSGDQHDWSVWHSRAPFSQYQEHFYRFVSEYGFQSFPGIRTVEAFTDATDRTSIFTPIMLAHQKSGSGNALILEYLKRSYPEPKDFSSLLYMSQILQAEGIKLGAEHLRRIRPRNMGSLYWQLNDCWPVASWSSMDYYGQWKALHYYAKRFYSPLLVSPVIGADAIEVYVVSDRCLPVKATLCLKVLSLEGTTLLASEQVIKVAPLCSGIYLRHPLSALRDVRGFAPEQVVVWAHLRADGEDSSSNVEYLVPTRQIVLPRASITFGARRVSGGCELSVSADVIARGVEISFRESEPAMSDNYFDLIPGETKIVSVRYDTDVDSLNREIRIRSLVDAFAS